MDEYGPCMCGGCAACLHEQGYMCGNDDCPVCCVDVEPDKREYEREEDAEDYDE